MDNETVKDICRRYNWGEQQVLLATFDKLPDITTFRKHNTETIVRNRIKRTNGNCLFLDAENSNLTLNGNNRKTEFRLSINKKDIWVEVKDQKSISNILDCPMGEIARAKNISGEYWLVLLNECYCVLALVRQFVEMIENYNLNNKVKLIYGIEQYKNELLKLAA